MKTRAAGFGKKVSAGAVIVALVLVAQLTPSSATTTTAWFKPGVPHSYSFADPTVATMGPMTWAYSTNQGGADLPAMWSTDNTTFTARVEGEGPDAYIDDTAGYSNDAFPNVPWGINNDPCDASTSGCDPKEMWAPSVAFVGRKWVSYHAVRVSAVSSSLPFGRFCIYVATASSPMGPFRSASSSPIVCPSRSTDPAGAVDPDVFVDEETNKAYLIWQVQGSSGGNLQKFYSRQLNSTGTGFASGTTNRQILINNAGSWEGTTIENPSMTYYNGAYVLLYSGNRWRSTSYATGYAVCSGPLGPCRRPSSNPLMKSATGYWGPGGADGLADQRGRFIAMYHAWTQGTGSLGRRVPHVAELKVTGTGLNARVSVSRRSISAGANGDSIWSFRSGLAYDRTTTSISGTYTPATGDYDGDGRGDIYWYGTWSNADSLWMGTTTNGTFSSRSTSQAGAFVPVSGDYDGDGETDIFWYQPGGDPIVAESCCSGGNYEPNARPDQLWTNVDSATPTITPLSVVGAAIPLPGDYDGDGDTDIIWSQPGDGPDTLWRFSGGRPVSSSLQIVGNYRPIVGDFDGNGIDDIFWYGPGAKSDFIWWFASDTTYQSVPTTVRNKDYRPFAANLDGDDADEIFWYTPGAGPDYLWTAISRSGTPTSQGITASGISTPVVEDFDGNGYDDILWYS